MNAEIGQILWYVAFTVLGFFLRHAGGIAVPPAIPASPSVLPNVPSPSIPADHPLLLNLTQLLSQILKLLQNQAPKT